MTDELRTSCSACRIGQFPDAREVAKVNSNVRRWKSHLSTIWRCPACDSLNSLERVDLNVFYADYPFRKRRLDGFTRILFSGLFRKLRHFGLNRNSTVLDYGCSEGLFVDYLKERGVTASVGYDAYVERHADPSPLEGTYDFVVAQDLIEHVERPSSLIASLASLVKPRGIVYLGTPCADRIDLGKAGYHIHSLHQPYHICILSERAMLTLGKEAGLNADKIEYGHIADTLVPFINWTFLRAYIAKIDDTLDAGFEAPRLGMIATSADLMIKGMFGYFWRRPTEMFAFFSKPP